MFSKKVRLLALISISSIVLSSCGLPRHDTAAIVVDTTDNTKLEQAKQKLKQSSISVNNGVIIYKDTRRYDSAPVARRRAQNDYIFGN